MDHLANYYEEVFSPLMVLTPSSSSAREVKGNYETIPEAAFYERIVGFESAGQMTRGKSLRSRNFIERHLPFF